MADSCNFGLFSYASGSGAVNALGGTSWSKINDGGNFMMTKCLLNSRVPEGGVVVIPSSKIPPLSSPPFFILKSERLRQKIYIAMQPTQGVLSLFMWETGSIFDQVLNEFNNNPAGIIPTPGNYLTLNSTIASSTTEAVPSLMRLLSNGAAPSHLATS